MSTRIEFRHKAIKITRDDWTDFAYKRPRERFVLLAEGGDSNVTGYDGKVARDWHAIAIGDYESVMRQVIRRSARCEGDTLKLNGRATRPEGYIKKMRATLDNAVEYAETGRHRYRIKHGSEDSAKYEAMGATIEAKTQEEYDYAAGQSVERTRYEAVWHEDAFPALFQHIAESDAPAWAFVDYQAYD